MCLVSKGDRHIIEKCNYALAKNASYAKTGWHYSTKKYLERGDYQLTMLLRQHTDQLSAEMIRCKDTGASKDNIY
jgi:hypothetical protein|tara:strand:- start:4627 stop:4851 length:225 start_codon:yes stop_codon:yes gene_type:complete